MTVLSDQFGMVTHVQFKARHALVEEFGISKQINVSAHRDKLLWVSLVQFNVQEEESISVISALA